MAVTSAQLRLHLLAHAPTRAQHETRFPAPDDAIEPIHAPQVARLAERVVACQPVWCAPERRAIETAEALGMSPTPTEPLRAWSAGTWTGRSLADVTEHDPTGFEGWRTDPTAAPPEGESLSALLARTATWVDAQSSLAGRALVIADPAVIRAIVVHVLQAPPRTFWRFDVPPLSLSIVQHASHQWRLRHLVLLD
jgi:broad specificity phosphatase PhoE